MGIFDKIKGAMSPDDDNYDDDFDSDEIYDSDDLPIEPIINNTPRNANIYGGEPSGHGVSQPSGGSRGAAVSLTGTVELVVKRPMNFKEADQIGECLLNKKTVIMNLEESNKETARRLIDFCLGVAFAIGGDIKQVNKSTFVVTPKDVDVTNEQIKKETNIGNTINTRDTGDDIF